MRIIHYLLLILFGVATAKSHQKRHEIPIQGQHFFSETEKSASYTLNKIEAKRPIVVILKNKNDEDTEYDAPLRQPITVTINDDGKTTVNCIFKRMNDMCRLQSVKSKTNTIVKQSVNQVRVACQDVPCDVIFEAFQPETTTIDMDKQTSFDVYRLYNVSQNNTILEFLNNDTKIQDFGSLIRLFTRADYEIFDDGNVLMFVFKDKLEDFFIEADPRVLRHSQMRVSENSYQVDFDKMERSLILDQREITINKMPKKELRLEMSVISVMQAPLKPFNITFYGFKAQNKTEIVNFDIEPDQSMPNSDISIVLKQNQISKYERMTFKISTKEGLMLIYRLNDTDVHEIEVQEESYFFLEKGQTVSYEIVSDPKSDQKLQVYAGLVTQESQGKVQLKLSENPCYYYKGCNLQITSKEDTQAGITVSFNKQMYGETKYIPLEKSITIQLFQGERKYLLFNTTTARDRVVSVSTSNVLIYASTDEQCKRPSKSCSDYLGNSNQPIAVENLTGPLYLTVQALELVRVTIRIDDKGSLFELEDGVPLTYNMRKAKEVYFKFKIKSKKSVNFNLIAPLNSFIMIVSNSAEKPDSQDVDLPSSSSFVKFEQNNVENLVFTVLVKRNTDKTNEDFVLIASTNNAIITLDRAEPHYDLLETNVPRYFAVLIDFQEFDSGIDTMLNLHVFQLTTGINMTARFGSSIKKFQSDELTITKSPYLIDINRFSQKLCQQQSDQSACHIFIELVNHNEHSLDVTLSVINNDSIIRLKSGIWQNFVLSELTSQNHFVFVPTNKRYPINLQFSHSFGEFKLAYTLWNNKLKETNSAKWPFPQTEKMPNLQEGMFQGNEYMITASEVEKCYPDCILLISLWGENKGGQFSFGSYRIMASDDVLELIEQHKMSITLAANESKSLIIDLQHHIQTDKTLTILTSSVLGYHECLASLLTHKNMTLPTEHVYDYRLDQTETQLTMQQLRKKLEQKKLDQADDVQIVLYCRSYDASRFIVEFTTKQNFIQKLVMGVPQTITIPPNSERYFSTQHYMDYRVKVIRVTSFPQIAYRTCNHSDVDNCYEKLVSAETSKVTDKVAEIREKYCAGCLLLIRVVSGDEKVVLEMITLSEFTAIELKEAQVTTDILSAQGSNLYKIHAVKNQNIVLTVTVFEGNPTVRVINTVEGINKSATKKGNVISITVSAAQFRSQQSSDNHNKPMLTNYAFSQVFSELIVEISDPNQNCSYSISYSLGERSLILQDGVLSSANLKHNESVIFNYHNYGSGMNSIVSISFGDSDMLDACEIKYSQVIGNEEPVIETPAKLEIKKKVPRPTLTFHLSDNYSDYEIIIRNTKSKEVSFNIIINHQDIILLPYSFEYPSFMGPNQTENLIVWAANEGYVEFIVRKCSSSDLSFAYALDDESYQKDEFNYETAVQHHVYTAFIKVHVGSIYVRLHSTEGSLYSIVANHYYSKKDAPVTDYKPGNKGALEYVVIKNREVEVSFTPIQCKGKCPNITYHYLLHENQENVVNQVACPSSFFLFQQNQVLIQTAIHPEKGQGDKLKFNVKLSKQIEFLGIKGVMENNREVAYPVIEIATFWGGVQRNRNYLFLVSGLSVLCILFCIVMQRRRRNRMKYQTLPQSFDPNA